MTINHARSVRSSWLLKGSFTKQCKLLMLSDGDARDVVPALTTSFGSTCRLSAWRWEACIFVFLPGLPKEKHQSSEAASRAAGLSNRDT